MTATLARRLGKIADALPPPPAPPDDDGGWWERWRERAPAAVLRYVERVDAELAAAVPGHSEADAGAMGAWLDAHHPALHEVYLAVERGGAGAQPPALAEVH